MTLLPMTRWRLLRRLDPARIEGAIRRAESSTSGEIRVSVAGFFRGDPRQLAEAAFRRLGMAATRHRNGVLVLIAPTRRSVVILGDEGIHTHVGDDFWQGISRRLGERFRDDDFSGGLVEAIDRIGGELAAHFPPDAQGDMNELPDAIDRGDGRGASPRKKV